MDVGCGTGIMGKLLQQRGFYKIEGADASESFTIAAQNTCLYQSVLCMYFGMGLSELPAELLNRYEAVVASGVWLEDHIPASGFDDVHAMLRPGGFFVTAMRSKYWKEGQKEGYKDKINQMVQSGKFKLVDQ